MSETEDYDKSATPLAHKTSHENGGSDEISVAGLSGTLADDQPTTWTAVSGKPSTFAPSAHKASHEVLGSDVISVLGLSGLLATPQTPLAHKTSHQLGGSDQISIAGLEGVLSENQQTTWSMVSSKPSTFPPEAHKTSHQLAGSDALSIAGLSGLLADDQHVLDTEVLAVASAKTHGSLHLPDAADPVGLPKFSAHKNNTDQTGVVSQVWTKITFPTEVYDQQSKYDAPNSRWIPGIIGIAHVVANVVFTAGVDQTNIGISVYINGSPHKSTTFWTSGASYPLVFIACDIPISNVTDYVEIYAYQNTGSDKIIYGHPAYTWFMGHLLP